MSHLRQLKNSSPSYTPDEFDFSDHFTVIDISEIHAFEPEHDKERYIEQVGKQIDAYADFYDADRVSVLGDTGSIEDVEAVFSHVNDETELWIVAGDEDKVERGDLSKDWLGWFWQANSEEPFDIGNEYRIFDEGYETEIRGHDVQAAHHPMKSMRDDKLRHPDPRHERKNDKNDATTPEELFELQNDESFLDRLFSVEPDSNENTMREPEKSISNADVAIYDHVHMPYPRKIGDKAVIGLGGRNHNYQIKADCLPLRSIHMTAFSEDRVHALHFDADKDQIFEHQIFEFGDNGLEMYDVITPAAETHSSTYKPIQARFLSGQYREEAEETEMPTLWRNR